MSDSEEENEEEYYEEDDVAMQDSHAGDGSQGGKITGHAAHAQGHLTQSTAHNSSAAQVDAIKATSGSASEDSSSSQQRKQHAAEHLTSNGGSTEQYLWAQDRKEVMHAPPFPASQPASESSLFVPQQTPQQR